MKTRNTRSALRFGILVIGILGLLMFWGAEADEPNEAQVGVESKEQETLDVRYARAHLKLAKLDLRRILAEHGRLPALMPISAAEEFQRHVAIDEEQLKQALKGPDGDTHEIYLRSAAIAVELAEADLKRKQKAYQTTPTEMGAMELERASAVLEVAKLHLEITHEKESSRSSLIYLTWQIEVLRNQVVELQLQVRKLEQVHD